MRPALSALAFLCVAAPLLFAQSAPPPLVERVNVSVINVDATVTDRAGNPVSGLTRDDFEISEDGKPQKIANFYAVEGAKPRAEPNAPAPEPQAARRFRRKAVLLIDNNFIDKRRRDIALAEVQKFIDRNFEGGYDWSVATIGAGVRIVQPFTADRQQIATAVARVRSGGTLPRFDDTSRGHMDESLDRRIPSRAEEREASASFQLNLGAKTQLQALAASAKAVVDTCRAYSSTDGKKLIVLVTGAMEIDNRSPLPDNPGNLPAYMLEPRENRQAAGQILEGMVRQANAANFNVYVINASGVLNPSPEDVSAPSPTFTSEGGGFASSHSSRNYDSLPLTLAWQTGGAYLPGNDVDKSLRRVDAATSNYYSLGYTPVHFEDGKYHTISVRVKRKGLRVAHRAGYYDFSTEQRLEETLRVSLSAATLPRDIAVQLQLGAPQSHSPGFRVPLTVVIPISRLTLLPRGDEQVGRLHVYLSVFDQNGNNVGVQHRSNDVSLSSEQLEQVRQLGSNMRSFFDLDLKKGKYRLVVAVRDEISNEIGVAAQDLRL